MGYDYTIIQVICWVELPEQRRLCSIFVKIWILINGTQQCGIGSPKSTRILQADWLSMGPLGFEASHLMSPFCTNFALF